MGAAHAAARQRAWRGPGERVSSTGQVAVWAAPLATPRAHWHLLTDGLWRQGYEVSLRVARAREEVEPPAWALALLERQIARARSGDGPRPDGAWYLVEANPMVADQPNPLCALAFAVDEQWGAVTTAWAQVPVWQLVPLRQDEERLVREWCPSGLVEVLRALEPWLVADPERPSVLESPRARSVIEQRVAREGSSLTSMQARVSHVALTRDRATWRLSADAVDTFIALLKGRTAHQRPFSVRGGGQPLEVRPGDVPALEPTPTGPTLKLSQVASRQLRAQLRARVGRYAIEALPHLTVEVV
jgi:hypothetical protein